MKKLLAMMVFAASFSACTDGTHPQEKATDTIPVTTAPVDTAAVIATDTATVK